MILESCETLAGCKSCRPKEAERSSRRRRQNEERAGHSVLELPDECTFETEEGQEGETPPRGEEDRPQPAPTSQKGRKATAKAQKGGAKGKGKVNDNKSYFNNISSIKIPKIFFKILNSGYKFITKEKATDDNIRAAFDAIETQIVEKYPQRSDIISPLKGIAVTNAILRNAASHDACQRVWLDRLNRFLAERKLIIKAADKNLGLTVMDQVWYTGQIKLQLSDKKYYELKALDPSRVTYGLSLALHAAEQDFRSQKDWHSLGMLSGLRKKFFPYNFDIPEFYIIPKIHKLPLKGRPIVPSYNWMTTDAAIWVDQMMQPLVKSIPWILPNSLECVKELETLCIYDQDIELVAADVESMYTNIDLLEAVPLIAETFFANHKYKVLIIGLLKWILENNYFSFQGTMYRQIRGTAMGSNVAPCFANLFLAAYEKKWMADLGHLFPCKYYRYLDDVFFVYTQGRDKLAQWCRAMNETSPSLRFTFDIGTTVTFLDLEISVGTRHKRSFQLDYNLFDKPTNRHLYTDPSSNQPDKYKFSWITGENIRLLRNSDSEKKFNENILRYKEYLLARNYPMQVINELIKYQFVHKFMFIDGTPRATNVPNMPLYIPNVPGWQHIASEARLLAPQADIVITKGRNLWDNFNTVNKKLLSADNMQPKRKEDTLHSECDRPFTNKKHKSGSAAPLKPPARNIWADNVD